MYEFTDVTEIQRSSALPAEAMKLNGEYLENQVSGYRTLYVSGRELLAPELTTKEVKRRNGVLYRYRRYPERVITVGFQLIASSNEAFRTAFNKLSGLLNVEEAQLIFADEPDKFFCGTPSGIGDIEPGRNAVTGEIEITCSDPFKYSVAEYIASPASDGSFAINYGGTAPAFPVLLANFGDSASGSTEDGCGYVAFVNDQDKIIQLGNPDEEEGESYEKSQTLVNQAFKTSDAWNANAQKNWEQNVGIYLSNDVTQAGSAGLVLAASELYFLTAASYGAGSKWHGPSVTYTLPTDAAGEEGASDFTLTYQNKVCIGKSTGNTSQLGSLQMFLLSASDTVVAGVNIRKNKSGTNATLRFYVDEAKVEDVDIDLSYNNKYFGNNSDSKGIKTVKTVKVTKTGDLIEFNAGGIQRSYRSSAVADMAVKKVQFTFMQYGNKDALHHCGLYSMKFVKHNCTTWKNVPNKFSVGDELVADCGSGEILLNELSAPELGAPGNDWETFYLQPGVNQIMTAYSDWVAEPCKPTFQIQYREAFL